MSFAEKYVKKTPACHVKITDYFFRSFKERHNVSFKTLCGEAKSAVTDQIIDFFEEYEFIKQEYEEQDIFNLDETGLYIKKFRKRSYIVRGDDDRKTVKTDKTRINIVLGFNKYGEELTPLVIGKSANPKAFKNVKLGFYDLMYTNNSSSWLSKEIFTKYMTSINDELILKKRKILLLLDNFKGHEIRSLSNIRLLF
ncbi:Tigger transposable element-derived protein 6, partial [Dictyocoela muelleri]